ncbi:hypothetical protein [Entomobacter blattae]|nr:hypothetical protein [Entomobacter blattae]
MNWIDGITLIFKREAPSSTHHPLKVSEGFWPWPSLDGLVLMA